MRVTPNRPPNHPLHQSLLGSPIPGCQWSPSTLKCLHAFHLFTYSDLVTWDRFYFHWSYREVTGPKYLVGALYTLALLLDTAVPLLPGQASHFSSDRFLADSSTITDILFINLTPPTVSTMASPRLGDIVNIALNWDHPSQPMEASILPRLYGDP